MPWSYFLPFATNFGLGSGGLATLFTHQGSQLHKMVRIARQVQDPDGVLTAMLSDACPRWSEEFVAETKLRHGCRIFYPKTTARLVFGIIGGPKYHGVVSFSVHRSPGASWQISAHTASTLSHITFCPLTDSAGLSSADYGSCVAVDTSLLVVAGVNLEDKLAGQRTEPETNVGLFWHEVKTLATSCRYSALL